MKSKGLLTPQEQRVLKLIFYSNEEIAEILNISALTVKSHKTILREKIGANSDRQLVILSLQNGLVKLEEFITERE